MANQLLLAYTLTPLWPFFTVATDFVTAIFWIPILWLQLFQINSPLLLCRVNNVTSKKLQCICKNARMLLYLTVYFSSKFDCLYVVSFSGLLGFCSVCFTGWNQKEFSFTQLVHTWWLRQNTSMEKQRFQSVNTHGTSLFICVSSLALWRIVENGNHQHQFWFERFFK